MEIVNVRALEHAYAYLRGTPPFYWWKLPYPHEVAFKITKTTTMYGCQDQDQDEDHFICISTVLNRDTPTLMATMAHEMVHIHVPHGKAEHGRAFKRCAALVCKYHGFDLETF